MKKGKGSRFDELGEVLETPRLCLGTREMEGRLCMQARMGEQPLHLGLPLYKLEIPMRLSFPSFSLSLDPNRI